MCLMKLFSVGIVAHPNAGLGKFFFPVSKSAWPDDGRVVPSRLPTPKQHTQMSLGVLLQGLKDQISNKTSPNTAIWPALGPRHPLAPASAAAAAASVYAPLPHARPPHRSRSQLPG